MAKLPTNEEIDAYAVRLDTYFLALGKVAHAWNHMQEGLGVLFCRVAELDNSMGMAIWHALRSDKSQRDMLNAAVKSAAQVEDWAAKFPHAERSITDLVKAIHGFSDKRNATIHAPCSVIPGEEDLEIFAVAAFGNPNAQKLRGKDILAEFAWYEATADTYGRYVRDLQFALSDARAPWPDKPRMPSLGQKSDPPSSPPHTK
jgi:hypothetical protein